MRLDARVVWMIAALQLSLVVEALGKTPNDPYYSYQTTLTATTPPEASLSRAWEITTDASDIVVAVIDTGVDLDHEDLKKNLWINTGEIDGNKIDDDGNGYVDDIYGYDFRNKDGIPEDEWGHGTLVSGIIGAAGDNGVGSVGVAWSVKLMTLKVFGESGTGLLADFVSAMRYAIQNKARIINASWVIAPSSSDSEISELKEVIQEAEAQGILVVAAAGNDHLDLDQQPMYPAAYARTMSHVISVAALNQTRGELLESSNYGLKSVIVSAPGEGLVAPYKDGAYATLSGSSAATGVVSGLAALMLGKKQDLKPKDIRYWMETVSFPLSSLAGKVSSESILDPSTVLSALSSESETSGRVSTQSGGGQGRVSGDSVSAFPGGCSLITY